MPFEWLDFLNQRGIDYVTTGPNVSRGNAAIHCPYCGPEDPSHHLCIRLDGRGWWCWRNKAHRGGSPIKLISTLLNCSWEQARQIIGDTTFLPEDFYGRVQSALMPHVDPEPEPLDLPREFRPFGLGKPSQRPFTAYLMRRGFTNKQIDRMTDYYDMHYCTSGPFHGRIMFPVYRHERLVAWTGRTISHKNELRYLASEAPITDHLLWFDDLVDCRATTICLTEGPFDALKTRTLGERHGITATCFFTTMPSEAQIALLHELLPRFRNRFLLLDHGAEALALRVHDMLAPLPIIVRFMPPAVKDPGNLKSYRQLFKILY